MRSVALRACMVLFLVTLLSACSVQYKDAMVIGEVECDNGLDEDGDNLIDCMDPDCELDLACTNCGNDFREGAETCDGIDLGGNTCASKGWGAGTLQCAADCKGFDTSLCTGGEDCTNGQDDDGDDLSDCEDPDCAGVCASTEIDCADDVDNDNDGLFDCDDSDCDTDPACTETICDDTLDNDGDGPIDCDDPDCTMDPACREMICDDTVDNDNDGQTDCDDSDCRWNPACREMICDDTVDNDGDGQTDCDDSDCLWNPVCIESICDDTVDNDGDGQTDCADSDCAGDVACIVCPDVNLGSAVGSPVTTGSTANEVDEFDGTCAAHTFGPDLQLEWTAPASPATGTYVFDTLGSSFDTVLYVLDGDCSGAELACNDDDTPNTQSKVSVPLTAGQTVILVVDGNFPSDNGDFVLNITAP